jgi:2-hydroxy-6-oxonona-2,4-dienedioate hydrolase
MEELTYVGTSRFLDTPQGRLHYNEAGEGPPLLLLHGSGPGVNGWANFQGNLPVFAERFRTLILDLPGFGESEPVEGGHPRVSAPDAVVRFLDGLGIDRSSMLGNSMGGSVAAAVAAEHPGRVKRLASIGGMGTGLLSARPAEGIKLLVEFMEDPTRERLVTWMESMVYDHALITDDLVEDRLKRALDPTVRAWALKMYNRDTLRQQPVNAASLAYLSKIEAPTLLLWGRDDRVSPLDGALVPMRLIHDCQLHVFPNCGHWAMIERKADFEDAVVPFFSRS